MSQKISSPKSQSPENPLFKGYRSNIMTLGFFILVCLSIPIGFFFMKSRPPKVNSPEMQLYSYVEKAINIVQVSQKSDLLRLTEGPLRSAINGLDDASFKEAYVDKTYQLNKMNIVKSVPINPEEFHIDFRLEYKSWSPGENPDQIPTTTMLNRAVMVFKNGRWAVSAVESLNAAYKWEYGIPVMSAESRDPNSEPQEVISNRQIETENQP